MQINTTGVLDGTTVHSDLTLSVASRNESTVTFNYSINTYLNASGHTAANYETYTAVISVSGTSITTKNQSVTLKALSAEWSGSTVHTVTGSFTVSTATYTDLTANVTYTTTSSKDSVNHGTGSGTIKTGSGKPPLAPSTVTASASVTAGNNLSVTITPASSYYSVSHNISVYIGNTVIATATTSASTAAQTVSIAIPLSAANLITSAMSGSATVSCTTVSGSTGVGTTSATTTVNVPSYSLSGTVTAAPVNQFSGNNLQNYTYLTVTADISSSYGATVSYSCTFNGAIYNTATFTTGAVTSSGSISVSVKATDSRGKTLTVSSTALTFLAYNPPTITELSAARDSTTPSNVLVTVKGTYYPLSGSNTATANVSLAGSIGTGTDTETPYEITVTVSANELYSYEGTVYVSDTVGKQSATLAFSVTSKAVQMDFHNSGKGVAFGKVAETSNLLECEYNAQFNGNVNIGGEDVADFIIEQGTSGVWTYRKWNSGVAECWGTIERTNVSPYTTIGANVLYAYAAINIVFPSNLFIEVPNVNYSAYAGSDIALSGTISGALYTSGCNLYAVCPSNGAKTLRMYVQIKGRWK